MKDNSKVSVCFVFQDNNDEITRLLNSLIKIDLYYCGEIIAIDNFSIDSSAFNQVEELKKRPEFQDIRIVTIRNKKKESLPHNRNLCYESTSHNLILFTRVLRFNY